MTGGTHLDVQAILPCNAHQYYVERDSAAFRALLAKALNLGVYKFRDTWQEGGSTFVRLVTKPEISSWVPSAVRNAVANASEIEFHDIIEYKPAETSGPSYTLHVRTESPFLGEKLRVHTTLHLTPLSENTTLQRLSGTVCVRMFGMGGLIEKAIRDNMVKTYHQLPGIISRWEAYRTEIVKNGDAGILLAGRPPVGGDLEYVRTIMQAPLMKNSPLESPKLSIHNAIQSSSPTTKADILATADAAVVEKEEKENAERVRSREGEVPPDIPSAYLSEVEAYIRSTSIHIETTRNAPAPTPALPRHTRRRTASSLILDALPSLELPSEQNHINLPSSNENQGENQSSSRHWRGFSWDSVGSQGSEAPTELEEREPGSKGAHKAWRRFNRDYAVWETYWAQIGVHAATAAQQGVVRIFHIVMTEVAAVARLVAIVLLLLLVRLNILRVDCSKYTIRNNSARTSTPPKRRTSSRLARTSSSVEPTGGADAADAEKSGVEEQHIEDASTAADSNFSGGIRQRSNSWFSLKKSATL